LSRVPEEFGCGSCHEKSRGERLFGLEEAAEILQPEELGRVSGVDCQLDLRQEGADGALTTEFSRDLPVWTSDESFVILHRHAANSYPIS
jgi:hypothetical protein